MRVLVTGSSAGIGRACALRLHQAGWDVVGAARRPQPDVAWSHVSMDVDDDASVTDALATVIAQRSFDAVVTCAGWGLAGAVETTPVERARAQFETNFWGTDRVVRAVLGGMRERGAGRIVLLGSLGGLIGIPFQAYYSATKFALEGWAEALALEVAPHGVHVTIVEPGNVRTEFTDRRRVVDQQPAYAAAASKAIETMAEDERNGVDPDDVAAVVQRVLGARRPPRRVSVGRSSERVGLVAKRLLPQRLFERAARGSLGL